MVNAQPVRALFLSLDRLLQPVAELSAGTTLNIAFLNAQLTVGSREFFDNSNHKITCEQEFKPLYLELKQAGLRVKPNLCQSASTIDICLVLLGKFKLRNEALIAKAARLTREGGLVMVAGAKNTGAASLRKHIAGTRELVGSFSKHHSIVFWFRNNIASNSPGSVEKPYIIDSGKQKYHSALGLFSADRLDPGSTMLIKYFDGNISGHVADLGAGWGYLSCELLRHTANISAIDSYEADWNGVEAIKKNLAEFSSQSKIGIHWHDIVGEPIIPKYDWVIMNPPFHQGTEFDLNLGQNFIECAASILKPKGKLLMVANQHLAYERIINFRFNNATVLAQANGFKIVKAQTPRGAT